MANIDHEPWAILRQGSGEMYLSCRDSVFWTTVRERSKDQSEVKVRCGCSTCGYTSVGDGIHPLKSARIKDISKTDRYCS